MSLKGKVAIVTGAAHPMGMGYAACRKLSAAGAILVVTDRVVDEQSLAEINARAAELCDTGAEAIAIAVDVTNREQIDACIRQVRDVYGRIDILFNNAGSPAGAGDFLTMTDQQWDISYQVNLKGMADLCQAALPQMIEQGSGTIINNASVAGLGAIPEMAAYIATKFAVVGLTKALAAEFGSRGVRVNAVCPGMIWTQMGQKEVEHVRHANESLEGAKARLVGADIVPVCRWGKAEEVADAVAYLASDASSYISGVALPVAGGMAPGL